ncbi:Serpentine Receptor, class T [Caenorhabditis elegans]|uniref:Serpentine Receptor, class T n=1 Tax=Caenorhabditis elegans TaxID=6239 RepID=Q965R2_CAEEL|nr:Serpentine Receptor, class T [Caenorhabditis elegans]CCD70066.1 Serpentine Receptor, class T [Caenorhabditis elegans]|eukprot:NP_505042.3 Serpentine Receptor, class T [Caenorhabditis elegans]
MNKFLYYGNAESIPGYNCSDFKPVWPNPNINLYAGTLDIVYGIIVIMLYVPTVMVFYKQSHFQACFKIMFFLGLFDIGAILINSITTGFLQIHGASYCDFPNFIYISGSIGLGFWCSACLTCLVLALNRILDMVCPMMVKTYFRGMKTCAVLMAPVLYGLFFAFFTPPVIFSAEHQTWFFDPRTMKGHYQEYTNIPHTINNFSLVFLTSFLYMFFCFKVRRQFRKSFRPKRTARQRQIFLQAFLLCLIHLSASILYVVMQFIEVPKFLTIISQYLWQLAQGCPVIIYLIFNRKVRAALLVFVNPSSQENKSSNLIRKSGDRLIQLVPNQNHNVNTLGNITMTKNYESEYQVRLQLIREANNVEVKHQKINNYNNNNKKDPE